MRTGLLCGLESLNVLTKNSERCTFFDQVATILTNFNLDPYCQKIIGAAFNTHLLFNFDSLGGRIKTKLIDQVDDDCRRPHQYLENQ